MGHDFEKMSKEDKKHQIDLETPPDLFGAKGEGKSTSNSDK
jgi:hypothetical protein